MNRQEFEKEQTRFKEIHNEYVRAKALADQSMKELRDEHGVETIEEAESLKTHLERKAKRLGGEYKKKVDGLEAELDKIDE